MKKAYNCFLISMFFLSAGGILKAQDCTFYVPKKQGTEIEMKTYNDKDKVQSVSKSKVLEVNGNTIKLSSEVFDDKGKSLGKSDFSVSCKNGEFIMDMSGFFKGINMDAYKDMDVKIETEDMHIPASLKAGDILDDGEMTMKINNSGFTLMNMKVRVYNRKVEKMENITTPAGTFECAKITYDLDTKMGVSISMKGIDWMAKNIGVVRSESYNSKGKSQGYTLLTSLK